MVGRLETLYRTNPEGFYLAIERLPLDSLLGLCRLSKALDSAICRNENLWRRLWTRDFGAPPGRATKDRYVQRAMLDRLARLFYDKEKVQQADRAYIWALLQRERPLIELPASRSQVDIDADVWKLHRLVKESEDPALQRYYMAVSLPEKMAASREGKEGPERDFDSFVEEAFSRDNPTMVRHLLAERPERRDEYLRRAVRELDVDILTLLLDECGAKVSPELFRELGKDGKLNAEKTADMLVALYDRPGPDWTLPDRLAEIVTPEELRAAFRRMMRTK